MSQYLSALRNPCVRKNSEAMENATLENNPTWTVFSHRSFASKVILMQIVTAALKKLNP